MVEYRPAGYLLLITRSFVPLDLTPAWDQPNRAVRNRMLRGVGGGSREASSYPYGRQIAIPMLRPEPGQAAQVH